MTIVIVHWNTPGLLKKLLHNLHDSTFQIVVVDNDSDKSVEWIRKDFPQVELIPNKINRGFAFACNQGVTKAVGEWTLFLNPDVEINTDQIEEMIEYAIDNKLDACSIKTENQSYQKPVPTFFSLLCEFTLFNKIIPLSWFKNRTLIGGCLLIKTNVLKSLGGWDERFFLWFEDSDLTARLTKKGYTVGWVSIQVRHQGGSSLKKLSSQTQRDIFFHSMEVYAKKHFSLLGQLIIHFIKKRYTSRKLLPALSEGVSITVPNSKSALLDIFFKNNSTTVSSTPGVEWIIVTSLIESKNIWDWRRKYPKVRFIPINQNKGFAANVNLGLRVSTGKWIGTVNDDTIVDINWLRYLTKDDYEPVGSINPIIYTANGEIESAGIQILPKGKAVPIRKKPSVNDRTQMDQEYKIEVDATNAAAVIYNKKVLNKIGLFDEKFGSYLEDIDLSLRIKRAGYKNVVFSNSKVIHVGQSTSRDLKWKKNYYDFRNWILVVLKNWSLKDLIVNFPDIFLERLRNFFGILKALIF